MHFPHPATRPRNRSVHRASTPAGFGALIEREAVLLRTLNSADACRDIDEQRHAVVDIIASLRRSLEQLPAPARFAYLAKAVQHAEPRHTSRTPPTGAALRRMNADLARQFAAVRAPTSQREAWEQTLAHAAAAHREMASEIRWTQPASQPPEAGDAGLDRPAGHRRTRTPRPAPPQQDVIDRALDAFVESVEQNDWAAMESSLQIVRAASEQQVQRAMIYVQGRRQISRGELLTALAG